MGTDLTRFLPDDPPGAADKTVVLSAVSGLPSRRSDQLLLGIAAILMGLLVACSGAGSQQIPAIASTSAITASPVPNKPSTLEEPIGPQPSAAHCQLRDGRLHQIISASDPARVALGHGVDFADGKVSVTLRITPPDSPQTVQQSFAVTYGMTDIRTSRSFLEGMLPIQNACALDRDPHVARLGATLHMTSD